MLLISASTRRWTTRQDFGSFMDLLDNTKKVTDVDVNDYDAIYITGGNSTIFDFRQSKDLESLTVNF